MRKYAPLSCVPGNTSDFGAIFRYDGSDCQFVDSFDTINDSFETNDPLSSVVVVVARSLTTGVVAASTLSTKNVDALIIIIASQTTTTTTALNTTPFFGRL